MKNIKTLEQCKDEVAQSYFYDNYKHYLTEPATSAHDDWEFHLKIVDDAAEIYANQFKPEWVSVESGLPEDCRNVLGVYKSGSLQIQCVVKYTRGKDLVVDNMEESDSATYFEETDTNYMNEGWYEIEDQVAGEWDEVYVSRKITHWMPLPELPQPPQK